MRIVLKFLTIFKNSSPRESSIKNFYTVFYQTKTQKDKAIQSDPKILRVPEVMFRVAPPTRNSSLKTLIPLLDQIKAQKATAVQNNPNILN